VAVVKYFKKVDPTPEQVKNIEGPVYGLTIVRGAAGSGKTTSAALRLRKVIAGVVADREASGDDSPMQVLVLTFNRTLKGYVEQLAIAEAHPRQAVNAFPRTC
jgi:DNA helicase IV